MSFILDALKKSENERQRKAGPALYEVKLAPPRNRLPWWMITVGALLGVNLIVVVWLLIRSPATKAQTGAAPVAAIAASPGAAAPEAGTLAAPARPSLQAASSGVQVQANAPAAASYSSPTLNSANPAMNPAANPAANPAFDSSLSQSPSRSVPTLPTDDLAPAVEPADTPVERVHTTTEAGIPSYQQALSTNTRIPRLHLDFHLYAAKPQDRFVFINMKKMHEGDATPEGVRVESINDEGVVLSFEGTRFTLLHE